MVLVTVADFVDMAAVVVTGDPATVETVVVLITIFSWQITSSGYSKYFKGIPQSSSSSVKDRFAADAVGRVSTIGVKPDEVAMVEVNVVVVDTVANTVEMIGSGVTVTVTVSNSVEDSVCGGSDRGSFVVRSSHSRNRSNCDGVLDCGQDHQRTRVMNTTSDGCRRH